MIETFEEWYEIVFKRYTVSKRLAMYGFVQLAWNHQQKKIDALEKKLAEALEHRNKLSTISTLFFNDLLEYQDESVRPLSEGFKIAQRMLKPYDKLKEKWDEEFFQSLEEKEGES